uniref:Ldh_1_C domain-containing protein n=1 Tax=Macrostomum lignano TaxID=282301 RepID=A0A1I8GWF5_9PLAT
SADCPYFAKVELLADNLAKNLPSFKLHKIVRTANDWPDWSRHCCRERGWRHQRSPIIWRELVNQGGKGVLIGGANEFQEFAKAYYDAESSMLSPEMVAVAKDNSRYKSELDAEEAHLRSLSKPLQVLVTASASPTAYQLLPLLMDGSVFGRSTELAFTLFDCDGLVMEAFDLAHPLVRSIRATANFQEAAAAADILLLLDDVLLKPPSPQESATDGEEDKKAAMATEASPAEGDSPTKLDKSDADAAASAAELAARVDWLSAAAAVYRRYADWLNAAECSRRLKVLLAGRGPVNFGARVLLDACPRLPARNVAAAGRLLERQAKGALAGHMKVRSGGIGDPHPAGVPDEGAEVSDIVRGGQLVHPLGVAEVFVPRLVETFLEKHLTLVENGNTRSSAAVEQRAVGEAVNALAAPVHTDIQRNVVSARDGGLEAPPDVEGGRGGRVRTCDGTANAALKLVQPLTGGLLLQHASPDETRVCDTGPDDAGINPTDRSRREAPSRPDGSAQLGKAAFCPTDDVIKVLRPAQVMPHGLTSAPIAGWTTPEQQVEDDLPRSDVGGKIVLLEGVFPLRGETHVQGLAGSAFCRNLLEGPDTVLPSSVVDLIVWGDPAGENLVDLSRARVHYYDGSITGPDSYNQPVLDTVWDKKWLNQEFPKTMRQRQDNNLLLGGTGPRSAALSTAQATADTVRNWWLGGSGNEIYSLGVVSEGWYGIPPGRVFSFPVRFQPKGA